MLDTTISLTLPLEQAEQLLQFAKTLLPPAPIGSAVCAFPSQGLAATQQPAPFAPAPSVAPVLSPPPLTGIQPAAATPYGGHSLPTLAPQYDPATPATTAAPVTPAAIPPTPPIPAQTPPVASPTVAPTAPAAYTIDQLITVACALMDAGQNTVHLLEEYQVDKMQDLRPEQYAAFAASLRALGGQI
jgi:hypothetical protein